MPCLRGIRFSLRFTVLKGRSIFEILDPKASADRMGPPRGRAGRKKNASVSAEKGGRGKGPNPTRCWWEGGPSCRPRGHGPRDAVDRPRFRTVAVALVSKTLGALPGRPSSLRRELGKGIALALTTQATAAPRVPREGRR